MKPLDFLAALGHDRFTAQVFRDREDAPVAPCIMHGSHNDLERQLRKLNERGAGVFFLVNKGDLKGRRQQNVVAVNAYFGDLDGSTLYAPESYPLLPTLIVESSPENYHLYWRVINAPLESFSHYQHGLASLIGGDPKVKDLPRVMRLPTYEHKKGEPFSVRVIHYEPVEYTHEQFVRGMALEPYVPKPKLPPAAMSYINKGGKKGGGRNNNHPVLLDRVAAAPEGQRNDVLFRTAAALANDVAAGLYDRETMEEELAAAAAQSGLSEREIRQTIGSALRYARMN